MTTPKRLPSLFVALLLAVPALVFAYEPPETLYEYLGEVNKVVDGNTLEVHIDLGFGVWMHKEQIRLKDVDSPKPTGDTLKEGTAAFKYLRELLADEERILMRTFWDPSGEFDGWLAEVSIWDEEKEAWVSVNDMVVAAGHGTKVEAAE